MPDAPRFFDTRPVRAVRRQISDDPPMDKLRIYYDTKGNTLSVWFDDPQEESVCEESDDDNVLMTTDRRQ